MSSYFTDSIKYTNYVLNSSTILTGEYKDCSWDHVIKPYTVESSINSD